MRPFNALRFAPDKKQLIADGVFAVAMLLTAIFVFWKCRYGFGNVDESFYLTVPYRLYKGDALFLEEWHLSQMAGVLTYPAVWLYLTIHGSTEGIILAMRYFCTFLQCAIAVFLYIRLRRISWAGAAVAALSFALYTPFGIMALSYNSMGIMALVVAFVIAYTARRHTQVQYVAAGLCFAAAVLCCPYLVAVYLLYLLAVVIRALVMRGRKIQRDVWSVWGALWVTAGAALAAVAFFAFVFSRASLADIWKAFPQILNDPEHPAIPFANHFKWFFSRIYTANDAAPKIYNLLMLLAAVCILDWGRAKRRLWYFTVAAVLTLVLQWQHYQRNDYINHLMWSVNVLAVFALILTRDRQVRGLFFTMWIPGILYAFCLNMTSNQGFYAISSASAAATVGSIVMIALFAKELLQDRPRYLAWWRYGAGALAGALLVVQLGTQCVLRYRSVFWETGMQTQTVQEEQGIQKGLIISEAWHSSYTWSLKNLRQIEEYEPEKVLFLSKATWYYLATDYEICTYSAWIAGVTEHSVNRLESYYQLNPEKLPDLVYADSQYRDAAVYFCQKMGYEMKAVSGGYILTPVQS